MDNIQEQLDNIRPWNPRKQFVVRNKPTVCHKELHKDTTKFVNTYFLKPVISEQCKSRAWFNLFIEEDAHYATSISLRTKAMNGARIVEHNIYYNGECWGQHKYTKKEAEELTREPFIDIQLPTVCRGSNAAETTIEDWFPLCKGLYMMVEFSAPIGDITCVVETVTLYAGNDLRDTKVIYNIMPTLTFKQYHHKHEHRGCDFSWLVSHHYPLRYIIVETKSELINLYLECDGISYTPGCVDYARTLAWKKIGIDNKDMHRYLLVYNANDRHTRVKGRGGYLNIAFKNETANNAGHKHVIYLTIVFIRITMIEAPSEVNVCN